MNPHTLLSRLQSNPAVIWILRLQFALLILAATYFCLTPTPEDLMPISVWDKAMHCIGWLGIFLSLRAAMLGVGRINQSAIGLFAYSSALECLQQWVPGRYFEVYDLFANGLGIAAGVLLWYFLEQNKWWKKAILR